MPRKSKKRKHKKPIPKERLLLSAKDIDYYISSKYGVDGEDFWKWFFSELDVNIVDLASEPSPDENYLAYKFPEYFSILKEDFIECADDDKIIEIENDLFN